jgi:hypothetical protein
VKRILVYVGLLVLMAFVGASLASAESNAITPRNDIVWAGLSCPAEDMVSSIHIDGPEMEGTSTPQAAIAPMVERVAPELSFDESSQRDLDPQESVAEFAVTDQQGNVVARFEANVIDGSWYPSGWRTCSSVGGANTPDPMSSGSMDRSQ